MGADSTDFDSKSENAADTESNNDSSLNLLLDSSDNQPRRPPPPICEVKQYIDEADQKKYEQSLDQAKNNLHEFPVSKDLRPQDVELLQQLQDAILSAGTLGGNGFRVDHSKFTELAQKLERGNVQGHSIVENLNASLAQYGVKVGHTTGELSLMIKDPSGQASNFWMVVHMNGKPAEAFFTDERNGRFFPLEPGNIFTAIQNKIVKTPEIRTKYEQCWRFPEDPIWPPPPPWRK